MEIPNKNKDDFPIGGLFAKIIHAIIPQRSVNLTPELVHQNPGQTFTGLLKNILKEKKAVWFLASGYFCETIYSIIYVTMPLILGQFVNILMQNNGITQNDINRLVLIASIMLIINAFANYISVRQADRSRGIGEALTRRKLTWWALGHSAGWFSAREAGQIAHRISEVSRQMNVVFGYFCWDIAPIIIALVTVGIVMYFTDLYAGLFFTFWTVIFLYQSVKLGLISQKFMMRSVKRRTEAAGLVTDAIINNSLVRLFDAKPLEDKNVNAHSQQCFEAYMESSTWARVKNVIRDTWIVVLVSCMILILGHGLINERINAAAFVAGMGMLFVLTAQIKGLHHVIRDLMEAIGAIREGLIEIGVPHDINEIVIEEAHDLQDKTIELKNVNFNYQNSKMVLEDINLHIPQGQKLGIVGPSGAGKTTLMALLLRLWDVEDGQINIGGQNIKDISSTILRKNMALIPQDTSLFHRTLMDNIRYGCLDASDEEVINAAKKSYAHDFISDLPDGYQTLVGERGIKLSGGQRQRIAIARAILKDPPILILDEATSALDSESEQLIQQSLKDLMGNKTVIAIAHRLSTIAHLDRLIVMDQGRIIQDGTHTELKEQDGLYSKLWSMQSGGFLGI